MFVSGQELLGLVAMIVFNLKVVQYEYQAGDILKHYARNIVCRKGIWAAGKNPSLHCCVIADEAYFRVVIDIKPETKEVNVYYLTTPAAAALQWLEPAQTAGGKRPYLFTQSQAILARTWVPCQDSPGVQVGQRPRKVISTSSTANPRRCDRDSPSPSSPEGATS